MTGWNEMPTLQAGEEILLEGEKMVVAEDMRCRITPSGRWYRCKLCGKLFASQRSQAVEIHYARECIARKKQRSDLP